MKKNRGLMPPVYFFVKILKKGLDFYTQCVYYINIEKNNTPSLVNSKGEQHHEVY